VKKLAVVALGGNALLRGNQLGTIRQQERNTYDTCVNLVELVRKDYNIIITHGNGPQVGNILLRNEAGYNQYSIPKMPLDICVADSQGGIGYMIERQLKNIFTEFRIKKDVISIVSQVIVDINDPAFNEPTKPIGTFYLKEEAELLTKTNNFVFKEDTRKRGWRRVVASPNPLDIINKKLIAQFAKKGNIVIAAGGGGIPVFIDGDKMLHGIDAVIDKDLVSSLLAREVEADELFILTDVPNVFINFNKPGQRALGTVKLEEIKKYYNAGEFTLGSMAPKIQAAIEFIENGGKVTIITEATQLGNENAGTRIVA
jgi:carbamate kinase